MKSDKEIKNEFRSKAWKNPEKYFAINVLKKEGFARSFCKKCGRPFWRTINSQYCGDPECSGGFSFINNSPAKNKYDYPGLWKAFSRIFSKLGYTPIPRYPVVARWREDTEFVQASIYDFQPYVVSGEVKPPANPLVVPQFSLRFNDIDNVGITGSHYTCFVMIGQHAFMKPKDWNQEKYFSDIHTWLTKGLGLPNNEIVYHEDAWAGGGNFGPCMEFFSRGLELGNQVYMLYENTPKGPKELDIKVLDMGMGHERNAWFTQGTSTSYETTFPSVVKKLKSLTGLRYDDEIVNKFLPYASYLNIDEIDNINKSWQFVSKKTGYSVNKLRETILPLSALYSLAEHSRSLLVAINDGALPSNTGGGYNLRILARRSFSIIEKYGWDVDFEKLCKIHATYLKPIFPELSMNLEDVEEILKVEHSKYISTKEKSRELIKRFLEKEIDTNILLTLYDSHGINPELVAEESVKLGKKIKIPENFYSLISELHEIKIQAHATEKEIKLNIKEIPETKALYFSDYKLDHCEGKVLFVKYKYVVLDKTIFYPTSGGQMHDLGFLNDIKVINVFKQGPYIIHELEKNPNFKINDVVKAKIDIARRIQLAQHHTLTHIINAAAKRVLGNHINQAGAKKTEEKAHIDITHYTNISKDQLASIEKEAQKIVKNKIPIVKTFMSREDAEKEFGVNIYQGGVVPGKILRIVNIKGTDVECCGGTHLDNTSEVGDFKILGSTKISDSIVRIEYKAGKALVEALEDDKAIVDELAKILMVKPNQVAKAVEQIFSIWKKTRKAARKNKLTKDLFKLESIKEEDLSYTEIIARATSLLSTQKEHLPKTVKRFKEDIASLEKSLDKS